MCDTRMLIQVRSPKIETKLTKYKKTVRDPVETLRNAMQQMSDERPSA
jgi:hypothetical protein